MAVLTEAPVPGPVTARTRRPPLEPAEPEAIHRERQTPPADRSWIDRLLGGRVDDLGYPRP